MNDEELLALHRDIVAIPSISHQELALVEWLQGWFEARSLHPERVGQNLVLSAGGGPQICLNSHLDTVPPGAGWTRAPHDVERIDGKIYGLGSNDAKASVAAMIATFVRSLPKLEGLGVRLTLALSVEEETGGEGAELLVREWGKRGTLPDAVVIGEPTGLSLVTSQKGLLVLELVAAGTSCHAAHGQARGIQNPIRTLARDLLSIDEVDLGPPDPVLGPVTLEPTVIAGGKARNTIPAEASCVLDVRTNPRPSPAQLVERLSAATGGRIRVRSDRLRPCSTPIDEPLVRSAIQARPQARVVGSRTLSDWVYFASMPAIKVGPGATERSHTADEFVVEREIVEGASFYEALLGCYGATMNRQRDQSIRSSCP